MTIICNNCGYERPPDTKKIGTECPICQTPYQENIQFSKENNNSALTKCKDCKKDVSKRASTCPHCGVSNPGITNKEIGQGCLVVLGIIFIIYIATSILWTGSSSDLHPHRVVDNTPLAFGGRRIHIHVDTPRLTEKECRELIEEYRSLAGSGGQVAVHKPSLKINGTMNPWCVDNMEDDGIFFNNALF